MPATNPGSDARKLEDLGRGTAVAVLSYQIGTDEENLNFFRQGFNDVCIGRGIRFTLEAPVPRPPLSPTKLPFFQRIGFKLDRFFGNKV